MHFFSQAALILLNERDYRTLIDAINVVMLFSDVASWLKFQSCINSTFLFDILICAIFLCVYFNMKFIYPCSQHLFISEIYSL